VKPDNLDILDASFVAALTPGVGADAAPPTFVEIAFGGRSNVGKSSLINTLVQRKGLVRTSGTPGCTRQVNLFNTRARDGSTVVLADLPGYGFAKRSKEERKAWAELIERYLTDRITLRGLVVVTDARRGFEEDDLELIEFARTARRADLQPLVVIPVATKIDRLPKSSAHAAVRKLDRATGGAVLPFSSVTGEGRRELWLAIRRAAGLVPLANDAGNRHKAAEENAEVDGGRGRVQSGS
jgi:GTP-binding protein